MGEVLGGVEVREGTDMTRYYTRKDNRTGTDWDPALEVPGYYGVKVPAGLRTGTFLDLFILP